MHLCNNVHFVCLLFHLLHVLLPRRHLSYMIQISCLLPNHSKSMLAGAKVVVPSSIMMTNSNPATFPPTKHLLIKRSKLACQLFLNHPTTLLKNLTLMAQNNVNNMMNNNSSSSPPPPPPPPPPNHLHPNVPRHSSANAAFISHTTATLLPFLRTIP